MTMKWVICKGCEGVGKNPHNGQECANCKGKGGWWDVNQDFSGWNLPAGEIDKDA